MRFLPNLLIVVGFCLGTLGAAGFAEPRESYALMLLIVGMVLLVFGGIWERSARRRPAQDAGDGSDLAHFGSIVETIRGKIVALDDARDTLDPNEIHQRIDELLGGDYFDLTSRNEELIALVGFNAYAKAWDGVASAERLLARCWSMISDGFPDEGLNELPLAREHFDHAAAEFAALGQG